jgi:hypothetical protein
MAINYEWLLRDIYESSLEMCKIMGDRERTREIHLTTRRLWGNFNVPSQGEDLPESHELLLASHKVAEEYSIRFNELLAQQEGKPRK